MKTNAQVAEAFVRREHAKSGSLTSTGDVLYSYETPIARHGEDGTIRLTTQTFTNNGELMGGWPTDTVKVSRTTNRHRSDLMSELQKAGYDGPAWWNTDLPARDYAPFGITGGQATDPNHDAVVWFPNETE